MSTASCALKIIVPRGDYRPRLLRMPPSSSAIMPAEMSGLEGGGGEPRPRPTASSKVAPRYSPSYGEPLMPLARNRPTNEIRTKPTKPIASEEKR